MPSCLPFLRALRTLTFCVPYVPCAPSFFNVPYVPYVTSFFMCLTCLTRLHFLRLYFFTCLHFLRVFAYLTCLACPHYLTWFYFLGAWRAFILLLVHILFTCFQFSYMPSYFYVPSFFYVTSAFKLRHCYVVVITEHYRSRNFELV